MSGRDEKLKELALELKRIKERCVAAAQGVKVAFEVVHDTRDTKASTDGHVGLRAALREETAALSEHRKVRLSYSESLLEK